MALFAFSNVQNQSPAVKDIRAILARFINAEPLHDPANSFELRETVRHVESELRYIGTGCDRLPSWRLPFQLAPIPANWRGRRAGEAAAALVVAIHDKTGLSLTRFMIDELNFLGMIQLSLEAHGGFLDEWRRRSGRGYAILDGVPPMAAPNLSRVARRGDLCRD